MRPISIKDPQTGKEIESIIAQVQGVISTRVILDGLHPSEIHVLADTSRSPKQIVRDIESAVMVKLGTKLDHKCISIAQLDWSDKRKYAPECRLQFSGISYSVQNREIVVTTTLSLGEEVFTASASGPNVRQNRLHLAARATLAAVEEYMDTSTSLMFNDLQKIVIAGQETVVVSVTYCPASDEEYLVGKALVKTDHMEAAVRAALDAVNRRLFLAKEK